MSATAPTPSSLGVFVGNANNDNSSVEATFDPEVQSFDSLMGERSGSTVELDDIWWSDSQFTVSVDGKDVGED